MSRQDQGGDIAVNIGKNPTTCVTGQTTYVITGVTVLIIDNRIQRTQARDFLCCGTRVILANIHTVEDIENLPIQKFTGISVHSECSDEVKEKLTAIIINKGNNLPE